MSTLPGLKERQPQDAPDPMPAVECVSRPEGQDLAYWSDHDVNVRQFSPSLLGTYSYRYGMLRRTRGLIEKLEGFLRQHRRITLECPRSAPIALLRSVTRLLNGEVAWSQSTVDLEKYDAGDFDPHVQDEFLQIAFLVKTEITRTVYVKSFEFKPSRLKKWMDEAARVWRLCRDFQRKGDGWSKYTDQVSQQFAAWYESNRKSRVNAEVQCELSMAMRKGYFILFETLTFTDDTYVEFWSKNGNGKTQWDSYCKRWKRLVDDEDLGYHSYICVVERGAERGRLHLHVIRVLERVPSWFADPNLRSRGTKTCIEGVASRMWPLSNPERSTWQPCRYSNDAWSMVGWKWPCDVKGNPLPYSAGKISNYLTKYLTKQQDFAINETNRLLEERIEKEKGLVSWRIRKSMNFGKVELYEAMKDWTSRALASVLEARYAPERKHLSLYRQIALKVLRSRVWKRLSESANLSESDEVMNSKKLINLSLLERFLVTPGQENLFAEVLRLWMLETLPFKRASVGAFVLSCKEEDVFRVEKELNIIYDFFMRPFADQSVGGKD